MNNNANNNSERGFYVSAPVQRSTIQNWHQDGQPPVEQQGQYQCHFADKDEMFQSNDPSYVKSPMLMSVSDPAYNNLYQSQQQLYRSSHLVGAYLEPQTNASEHNQTEGFTTWPPHEKSVEHQWAEKIPENVKFYNKQHVLSDLAAVEMSCSLTQSLQILSSYKQTSVFHPSSTSQNWNAQLKDSNMSDGQFQNTEQNMLTMAASNYSSKTYPFEYDCNNSVSVSPCAQPQHTSQSHKPLPPLSSITKYQTSTKPQTREFSTTSGQPLTAVNVVTSTNCIENADPSKCHRWEQLPPGNSHQATAVNQNSQLSDNESDDSDIGELLNLSSLRNKHEHELDCNFDDIGLGELFTEAGQNSHAKGKFSRPHVDFPLEFWTEEMTFWFKEKKRLNNYIVHKKHRRGYWPVKVEAKMKVARNIFKRLYRQRMDELSTRNDLDFDELKKRKDVQIKMYKTTEFRPYICMPPEKASPISEITQPPSHRHWHKETKLTEPVRQQAVARVMEKVFTSAAPFSRFHGLKDMVEKVTAEKEKKVVDLDKYNWGKPYRHVGDYKLFTEKLNLGDNEAKSILNNTLQASSLATGELQNHSLLGPPPGAPALITCAPTFITCAPTLNPGPGLLGDFPATIHNAFQLAASVSVQALQSFPKNIHDYPPNPRSLGPGLLGDSPVPAHDTMKAATASSVLAHKDVQKYLNHPGSLFGPDLLKQFPVANHDAIKPASSSPVLPLQSVQKKTSPVLPLQSVQKKTSDYHRKVCGSDLGKFRVTNRDSIQHTTPPVLSHLCMQKSRVVDIGLPSLYSMADRVEEDVTVPVEKHLFTGCPTQPHNSKGGPFKHDSFIVPPQDHFLPLRDADGPIVDNRVRDTPEAPSKLVHYREGELHSGFLQGVFSGKILKANYFRTPLYDPFTNSCLPEDFDQLTERAVKDSNFNFKSFIKQNRPRLAEGNFGETRCADENIMPTLLGNDESCNREYDFSLANQSSNITHEHPTSGSDLSELQKQLKQVQVNLQKKLKEDNHYKWNQSEATKVPQERKSANCSGKDVTVIYIARKKQNIEDLAKNVMKKLSERKDCSNKSNGVIASKGATVKEVEQQFIGAVDQGTNITPVREKVNTFSSVIQSRGVKSYLEHVPLNKLNEDISCADEIRKNVSMAVNRISVDDEQVPALGNKVITNCDYSPATRAEDAQSSFLKTVPVPLPDHRIRPKVMPAHNIPNVSNFHRPNLGELLRRIEVNLDKKMKSDHEQEKDHDLILSRVRQSRLTAEDTYFDGRQREWRSAQGPGDGRYH